MLPGGLSLVTAADESPRRCHADGIGRPTGSHEGMIAPGFKQPRIRTDNDGDTKAHRFENRNPKPFENRGEHEGGGTRKQGLELPVWQVLPERQPRPDPGRKRPFPKESDLIRVETAENE